MDNIQKHPVKLYIQDIFRAQRTENKYIFEMFDLKFKNIMIHGVVTSIYNTREQSTNFEVSDPTGCVQVYYDRSKNNTNITKTSMNDLVQSFASISKCHDENVLTMSSLLNSIECKYKQPFFEEGSWVSVVGDIYTDTFTNSRHVSAYLCKKTSVERDVLWMEELHYLYERYYLKNLVDSG